MLVGAERGGVPGQDLRQAVPGTALGAACCGAAARVSALLYL